MGGFTALPDTCSWCGRQFSATGENMRKSGSATILLCNNCKPREFNAPVCRGTDEEPHVDKVMSILENLDTYPTVYHCEQCGNIVADG
jgi:DNA-directed RNA polymerase subunit RPC12/RpoP